MEAFIDPSVKHRETTRLQSEPAPRLALKNPRDAKIIILDNFRSFKPFYHYSMQNGIMEKR
jgi:hypothetical protein